MTNRENKFWNKRAEAKISPDHLGDVIALTSDIVIVTDLNFQIHHIVTNPEEDDLGCLDHWANRDVRDFLTEESIQKIEAHFASLQENSSGEHVVTELNHTDNATWEFPIRYKIFQAADTDAILMVGQDLRPVAEVQQQLVKAQMALERDYEAFRDFDTRYRAVMEATDDAIVFVDATSGRIEDVNAVAATLLGNSRQALIGAQFFKEFEERRQTEFVEQLNALARSDSTSPTRVRSSRRKQELTVAPTAFRAAGQLLLLCRLDTVSPSEPEGASLSGVLNSLFSAGSDAMVFTDQRGRITEANESFLNLVDAADLEVVQGQSISEFLLRGGVDMKVLTDSAVNSNRMRVYATKVTTAFGSQIPAEIAATKITHREQQGFAYVIRDVAQRDTVREGDAPIGADRVQNLTELVGSSPLKDIVAATTDVIEKMCIETAVELTQNNRVAAAEMLGLSRQSLYVKLRKFGLLKKGSDS